jgi:1-acyl-sn-glycerol-3-phosphate acyltransferase
MTKVATRMARNTLGARLSYRFVRGVCAVFCRGYLRMSVEGRSNLPTEGAYIISPVHRSYIDTLIAGAANTDRMRYLAKDSLWRSRPLGWFVSSLGGFPVSRGTADREALRRCIEVIEQGEPLVLFPEGERKSGRTVQPLFDGAAYVASKTGVPMITWIVPIGIGGSERAMPKGKNFIRPYKVHVIIGTPLRPRRDESGKVPRAAVKELSEQLHRELQVLFDRAQAKVGQL